MNKSLQRLCLIAAILILSVTKLPGTDNDKFTINNIKFPSVKSFKLSNGTRIYYINEDLPKLTIVASIGFGKLYEKKNNAGISDLISKTISLAGSKKYPGENLHEIVESIGGKLSIFSSWENTVISIKVLKRHKKIAFNIISDIIKNPNFDDKYIETSKSILVENIKRKYDDPANIAFEKAREVIFNGDGYGTVPTEKGVRLLTRDMLIQTWDRYFRSKNIIIGISSSIDFTEIKRNAYTSFSSWEKGKRFDYDFELKRLKDLMNKNKTKIYLFPKNIPQSTIVVGTIAPVIGYKGEYALSVMNYILGGGSFNSRLMKEIRVKRGLAYAVQSVIRFRYKTGVFLAFAQTKNESVDIVLSAILDNIKKMSRKKVSVNELNWAKKSICNSYIFRFDTPLNVLNNYIDIKYNNLPEDYYVKYLGFVDNVREDDIVQESKKLINDGLIKVVVGKYGLREKLKRFGEVIILK